MRKITYGGAVSLDLYLAGPAGEMDWLRWSDDVTAIIAESWKGVDTMLVGRKSWGPGAAGFDGRTFVFSRTLESVEGAELVSEDAADFVRRLKSEPGGDMIVMGGGELGSALVEAGLVDEIGFNVHPILLGGGVPALRPMAAQVELELVEARPIARECVLMRYRVKPGPAG